MYGTFRLACTNYLIHRRRKKKVGTQRVQKNNKRKKKLCAGIIYAHSVRIFIYFFSKSHMCAVCVEFYRLRSSLTLSLISFLTLSLSPPTPLHLFLFDVVYSPSHPPPFFFAVLLLLSM